MRGIELFEKANDHVGEKYVFGARVPKDVAGYRGPWDCAEFASYFVYQFTRKLYGCEHDAGNPHTEDAYTGYWGRDAHAQGTIVSVAEAAKTPGAFILRVPQAHATGHIVISNGDGATVEAHSTKLGVINNRVTARRWDYGILVPGFEYSQRQRVVVALPDTIIYRYVPHNLMHGVVVLKIQDALSSAGYEFKKYGMDGWFGAETADNVVQFQRDLGMLTDGEVGPDTAKALKIL